MRARLELAPEEQEICARCRPDFSALLDNELDTFRKAEIEEHLATASVHCTCLHELEQLKQAGDLCRNTPAPTLAGDFSRLVVAAARKKVRRRRLWHWLAPWLAAVILPVFFVELLGPWLGLTQAPQNAAQEAGAYTLAQPARKPYREVAGRVFARRGQGWAEVTYADQPCNSIVAGAATWVEILDKHPSISALAHLDLPVTFEINGIWYRLVQK